jgi:hypothetical protein
MPAGPVEGTQTELRVSRLQVCGLAIAVTAVPGLPWAPAQPSGTRLGRTRTQRRRHRDWHSCRLGADICSACGAEFASLAVTATVRVTLAPMTPAAAAAGASCGVALPVHQAGTASDSAVKAVRRTGPFEGSADSESRRSLASLSRRNSLPVKYYHCTQLALAP